MGIVEQLPASRPRYAAPRPLDASDQLEGFDCGKQPLNDFLTHRALKNEGKASRTYVVVAAAGETAGTVAAYYTLSAGAVSFEDAPGWARRNMPNPVPVFVLGRLAVDSRHQGNGLGKGLMREALLRAAEVSRLAGARALVVHAVDDDAVGFYVPYGFRRFPTDSRTLFLPIETVAQAL